MGSKGKEEGREQHGGSSLHNGSLLQNSAGGSDKRNCNVSLVLVTKFAINYVRKIFLKLGFLIYLDYYLIVFYTSFYVKNIYTYMYIFLNLSS